MKSPSLYGVAMRAKAALRKQRRKTWKPYHKKEAIFPSKDIQSH